MLKTKFISADKAAELLQSMQSDNSNEEFSDDMDKDCVVDSSDDSSDYESNSSDEDAAPEPAANNESDDDKETPAHQERQTPDGPPPKRPRRPTPQSYDWSKATGTPASFPFNETPGLKEDIPDITIASIIDVLLTEEFWTLLVEKTNQYAHQLIDMIGPAITRSSRLGTWKDTDVSEMKRFFGLILHMGTCKMLKIENHWSTDVLYNSPLFPQVMSRNRFQL